ncbi:hypothetical protein BJI47_21785 [Rhodococcus sp. 1168]|nr:hypothetical protein BJI47_21785 [Rhodococcus sp. 1168]
MYTGHGVPAISTVRKRVRVPAVVSAWVISLLQSEEILFSFRLYVPKVSDYRTSVSGIPCHRATGK